MAPDTIGTSRQNGLHAMPTNDEAATEVGIDQPAFCPIDRIPQSGVVNPLSTRETRCPLCFEESHAFTKGRIL